MKRPSTRKVENRFIDLVLAVARNSIAQNWKDIIGPTYKRSFAEMEKWMRAEEEAVLQEERSGIRLRPLSQT